MNSKLHELAQASLQHPWFADGEPPIVLSVSRLMGPQKDPATLLRAFALVRKQRSVRLMLLGDGPERASLERLASDLGVSTEVEFSGWVDQPYNYMRRAGVMVLSSLWEGLPTVLIEALACGCKIVATDCPGGSTEILGHGKIWSTGPRHTIPGQWQMPYRPAWKKPVMWRD